MAMKIEKSTFGATKHGEPVSCYTIYTPDLRVKLLDYGATVQSLFVKDNDGKWVDVVLGYDTIREYEDRHSISAGNGVFYAFCGDMEVATPLLAVTSQPAYCSMAFEPQNCCRMQQEPRIRTTYTSGCKN